MSSFENFVQCRIVTPFTAAATEIGLFAADTPHRLPAEGGGVLVLTDSPYRPSVLEVIRYGRRTGLALYDVSRAQEGTTARDWTGVAFCYQALTAGELALLLAEKADVSALNGLRQEAQTALDSKVDKIAGKGLSTNDYTTAEKNKLASANLTALVGLAGAADRLPYFTGAGALSLATITAAARTLLAATNVAGQQSALGLFADASGVMTNASGALTNFVSQLLRSADAAAGRNALGLGSAATKTVVGGPRDTSPNRVLTVGYSGWGTALPEQVGSHNALLRLGNYYSSGIYEGKPISADGALLVTGSDTRQVQDFTAFGAGRRFFRVMGATNEIGSYTDWYEFLHSGNQLHLGATVESARTVLGIPKASSEWAPSLGDVLTAGTLGVGRERGVIRAFSSLSQLAQTPAGATFMLHSIITPAEVLTALGGWGGGDYPYVHMLGKRDSVTTTYPGFVALMTGYSSAVRLRMVYSQDGETVGVAHIFNSANAAQLPLTGSLSLASDNAASLGISGKQWSTAYLGTAPIVTSDRDAKMDILPIDDAVLDAWATLGYMQYRLKDAVAAKGEAARTHAGLIAQDIREAFESAGLNPFKYGVLCYDEWEQELLEHPAEYEWITVPAVLDDEGNEVEPERQEQGELIKEAWTEVVREAGHRYSVRYEEAFALECALQRRTTERLEQRLAALESAA